MGCDLYPLDSMPKVIVISIHAARVGCDRLHKFLRLQAVIFQSTQPEWAATVLTGIKAYMSKDISIHAARVGCDQFV